jgi:hypothetical protein
VVTPESPPRARPRPVLRGSRPVRTERRAATA